MLIKILISKCTVNTSYYIITYKHENIVSTKAAASTIFYALIIFIIKFLILMSKCYTKNII